MEAMVLFVLLMGYTSVESPQEDSSLRTRVDAEFLPALERLEQSLSNFGGSVSETILTKPRVKKADGSWARDENGKSIELQRKYDFLFSKTCKKESTHQFNPATKKNSERVVCLGKGIKFILSRPLEGNQYALREHHLPNKESQWAGFMSWKFLSAPFAINGFSFSYIMRHPSFSIRNVSWVEHRGKKCVKIVYICDGSKDPKLAYPIQSGWLIVSPDDQWSIQEVLCDWEKHKKNYVHIIVEYPEKPIDGVPVPSKVTIDFRDDFKTVYELKHIEFKKAEDREFTLAYFGLPDIDKPAPARTVSKWPAIFISLAILALVVSIALKIWSDRKQKVESAA